MLVGLRNYDVVFARDSPTKDRSGLPRVFGDNFTVSGKKLRRLAKPTIEQLTYGRNAASKGRPVALGSQPTRRPTWDTSPLRNGLEASVAWATGLMLQQIRQLGDVDGDAPGWFHDTTASTLYAGRGRRMPLTRVEQ